MGGKGCFGGALHAAALVMMLAARAIGAPAADLVITHARILTQDGAHHQAQALASASGRILYVGTDAGAQALASPTARQVDAGGHLVLPGLIDAHIHPLGIVQFDSCDLKSQAMSLAQISTVVRACIEKFKPAAGEWLTVDQWNYAGDNAPDRDLPTLRAALDRASATVPIQLRGNDGHHGGFNSAALARASNAAGHRVGLSRSTLASDFARFRPLIGVDAGGEPNGAVDEEARAILGLPKSPRLKNLLTDPAKMVQALHRVGITAIQDAAASDDNFTLYDALLAAGKLDVRVNAAQYFAPQDFRDAAGKLEVSRAVDLAKVRRAHYAGNPLLKAEAVKIFADGVLEGDPNADPPTLPHGAQIQPFLLPRFRRNAQGALEVAGYLDQQSEACRDARANPQRWSGDAAIASFRKANGYAPASCTPYRGVLTLPRPELYAWAEGFHRAGFTLHVHAIGDDALRATLEAIERARRSDGVATQLDTIAHAQLIHPDDVIRLGKDHINLAFTYAWAYTEPEYDITLIPFIDKVTGTGPSALHEANFYYERNAYPVRSAKAAGATLIAGSDAPVDTRDPRPFVNMQMAVTRRFPGQPALNPAERVALADVLDAYTINGARALGRGAEIGSLEPGKSADFIIIDQDIVALERGDPDRIGKTKVLSTWFQGRNVYAAEKP
ncbi:MAG: amidohydrolase family protein [Steroidobacteraceae bacterium]